MKKISLLFVILICISAYSNTKRNNPNNLQIEYVNGNGDVLQLYFNETDNQPYEVVYVTNTNEKIILNRINAQFYSLNHDELIIRQGTFTIKLILSKENNLTWIPSLIHYNKKSISLNFKNSSNEIVNL